MRLRATLLICALLMSFATIVFSGPARADPLPPGARLVDGYIPRFDQKRDMEARFGLRHQTLRERILARGHAGEALPCSSQILEETDWLLGSTRDAARIERRLDDLEASLKRSAAEQAPAGEQSSSDGSWGECYEEWFLRQYASTDPVKELLARGEKPRHPLRFMDEVGTPEKVVERFRRLKISRVLIDGRDHRKELNLTVTGLGQFLFLPQLASAFEPGWPRGSVADALIGFMDREWQDPNSGYFGAIYAIGDRTIATNDLSMTFHIVSYRDGKVPFLPQMVRTLFRTRDRPYPHGWQDRGTQNCHHAYDVVRLVRFGWPHMNDEQRAFAQAQLVIILARTLKVSINAVGEVDVRPYNRVAEGYYFCVSLLDDIGYFRPSRKFWTGYKFDDAEELRGQLLRHLDRLPQSDPMTDAARRKLLARD